jgi:hypothetical protein
MDLFHTLIPIFILWELLSLFGVNNAFQETLKEVKIDETDPSKALSLALPSIGYLIISIGYIVWSIIGLFVSNPIIFISLLALGSFTGAISKKKPQYQNLINKVDSFISLILLGGLFYMVIYGITLSPF